MADFNKIIISGYGSFMFCISPNLETFSKGINTVVSNIELNLEVDESLFDMETPEDYEEYELGR